MTPSSPFDQERYDRARQRVELVRSFYSHAVVFVIVNAGLAVYNLATDPGRLWFMYSVAGWGIGLVAHGAYVAASGRFLGPDWQARKIRDEMERDERRSR